MKLPSAVVAVECYCGNGGELGWHFDAVFTCLQNMFLRRFLKASSLPMGAFFYFEKHLFALAQHSELHCVEESYSSGCLAGVDENQLHLKPPDQAIIVLLLLSTLNWRPRRRLVPSLADFDTLIPIGRDMYFHPQWTICGHDFSSSS